MMSGDASSDEAEWYSDDGDMSSTETLDMLENMDDKTNTSDSASSSMTLSNNNNKWTRENSGQEESTGTRGGMKQVRDMISRFEQSKTIQPKSKQPPVRIPKKKPLEQDREKDQKPHIQIISRKSTEPCGGLNKVPHEASHNTFNTLACRPKDDDPNAPIVRRKPPEFITHSRKTMPDVHSNDIPGKTLTPVRQRFSTKEQIQSKQADVSGNVKEQNTTTDVLKEEQPRLCKLQEIVKQEEEKNTRLQNSLQQEQAKNCKLQDFIKQEETHSINTISDLHKNDSPRRALRPVCQRIPARKQMQSKQVEDSGNVTEQNKTGDVMKEEQPELCKLQESVKQEEAKNARLQNSLQQVEAKHHKLQDLIKQEEMHSRKDISDLHSNGSTGRTLSPVHHKIPAKEHIESYQQDDSGNVTELNNTGDVLREEQPKLCKLQESVKQEEAKNARLQNSLQQVQAKHHALQDLIKHEETHNRKMTDLHTKCPARPLRSVRQRIPAREQMRSKQADDSSNVTEQNNTGDVMKEEQPKLCKLQESVKQEVAKNVRLQTSLQQEQAKHCELQDLMKKEETKVARLESCLQQEQAKLCKLQELVKQEEAMSSKLGKSLQEEQTKNCELRVLMKQKEIKIDRIGKCLQDEETKLAELQVSMEQEEAKSTRLENSLLEEQTNACELQDFLKQKETKIIRLEKCLHEEETKLSNLQELKAQEESEMTRLRNSLEQERIEICEMRELMNQDKTKIIKLENSLQQEQANLCKLHELLKQEEAKSTRLEESLREEQTKLCMLQELMKQEESRISSLEISLKQEQVKNCELQELMKQEEMKSTRLGQSLQEEQTKLSKLQELVKQEQAKSKEFKLSLQHEETKNYELQELMKQEVTKVTRLEKFLQQEQTKLSKQQELMKQDETKSSQLQESLQEEERKRSVLEESLNLANSRVAKLQADMARFVEEFEDTVKTYKEALDEEQKANEQQAYDLQEAEKHRKQIEENLTKQLQAVEDELQEENRKSLVLLEKLRDTTEMEKTVVSELHSLEEKLASVEDELREEKVKTVNVEEAAMDSARDLMLYKQRLHSAEDILEEKRQLNLKLLKDMANEKKKSEAKIVHLEDCFKHQLQAVQAELDEEQMKTKIRLQIKYSNSAAQCDLGLEEYQQELQRVKDSLDAECVKNEMLHSMLEEHELVQKQVTSLEHQLQQARQDNRELHEANAESQVKLDDMAYELELQIQTFNETVMAEQSKVTSVQDELDSYRESTSYDIRQREDEYNHKLIELQEELDAECAENTKLKEQYDQDRETLEKELNIQQQENRQLVDKHKQNVTRLEEKLQAKQTALTNLREEHKHKLEALREQLYSEQKEKDTLKDARDNLCMEMCKIKEGIKLQLQACEEGVKAAEDHSRAIESKYEQKFCNLKQTIDAEQKIKSELQAAKDKAVAQMEYMQVELHKRFDAFKEVYCEDQKRIADLDEELSKHQAAVDTIAKLRKEIYTLKARHVRMVGGKAMMELEIETLKKDLGKSITENSGVVREHLDQNINNNTTQNELCESIRALQQRLAQQEATIKEYEVTTYEYLLHQDLRDELSQAYISELQHVSLLHTAEMERLRNVIKFFEVVHTEGKTYAGDDGHAGGKIRSTTDPQLDERHLLWNIGQHNNQQEIKAVFPSFVTSVKPLPPPDPLLDQKHLAWDIQDYRQDMTGLHNSFKIHKLQQSLQETDLLECMDLDIEDIEDYGQLEDVTDASICVQDHKEHQALQDPEALNRLEGEIQQLTRQLRESHELHKSVAEDVVKTHTGDSKKIHCEANNPAQDVGAPERISEEDMMEAMDGQKHGRPMITQVTDHVDAYPPNAAASEAQPSMVAATEALSTFADMFTQLLQKVVTAEEKKVVADTTKTRKSSNANDDDKQQSTENKGEDIKHYVSLLQQQREDYERRLGENELRAQVAEERRSVSAAELGVVKEELGKLQAGVEQKVYEQVKVHRQVADEEMNELRRQIREQAYTLEDSQRAQHKLKEKVDELRSQLEIKCDQLMAKTHALQVAEDALQDTRHEQEQKRCAAQSVNVRRSADLLARDAEIREVRGDMQRLKLQISQMEQDKQNTEHVYRRIADDMWQLRREYEDEQRENQAEIRELHSQLEKAENTVRETEASKDNHTRKLTVKLEKAREQVRRLQRERGVRSSEGDVAESLVGAVVRAGHSTGIRRQVEALMPQIQDIQDLLTQPTLHF